MPIVYFAGFNGTSYLHTQRLSNLVINNSMSYTGMTLLSTDNGINRIFGQLNGGDSPGPNIVGMGRRFGNVSYAGSVFVTVGPSSTDANSSCLAITGDLGNPSDWIMGWGMYFSELGFTATTSFRVGFRMFRPNRYTNFPFKIADLTSNVEQHVRLQFTAAQGSENYYEVEWFADTKTLNLYIDDELVTTTGPNFTTYNPWVSFSVFTEVYNGNTARGDTHSEFKDLYVQRIDSEADVRLGSATRVWPFLPTTDDDVSYLRPAGYNSNAAVAALTMFGNASPLPSLSSVFLSATEIGQYDMYNTNADGIASKLATIEAVQVRGYGMNPLAGNRQFSTRVSLNGSLAEAPPIVVQYNTGYRHSRLILNADPNGTRWTPATVAALKIGTQVKA